MIDKTQMFSMYSSLLATNGISVVYDCSIDTAQCDVENKVVYIPIYTNMKEEAEQSLVCHEVSHAIHSTKETFEKYSKEGISKGLVNLFEDIYVDKQIKVEYPGIEKLMGVGYRQLHEMDICNVKKNNIPLDEYSFENRINLYFKFKHCLEVPFSEKEFVFIEKLEKMGSRADFDSLIKEFMRDYYKEEDGKFPSQESLKEDENALGIKKPIRVKKATETTTDSLSSSGVYEQIKEEKEDENSDSQVTSQNGHGDAQDSPQDDSEDKPDKSTPNENSESSKSNSACSTMDAFNQNIKEKTSPAQKIENDKNLINYTMNIDTNNINFMGDLEIGAIFDRLKNYTYRASKAQRDKFNSVVKSNANLVSSMFNSQKNSINFSMSTMKNKGILDNSKLHAYKSSENIFKRLTLLPNQQNHAVVILLDFSGSMRFAASSLIIQSTIVAEFCKSNKIPFTIYTYGLQLRSKFNYKNMFEVSVLATEETYKLEDLCNLFFITQKNACIFGGTPMASAVLESIKSIKKYKAVGYENILLFLFTDGIQTEGSKRDYNQAGIKTTYSSNGVIKQHVVSTYEGQEIHMKSGNEITEGTFYQDFKLQNMVFDGISYSNRNNIGKYPKEKYVDMLQSLRFKDASKSYNEYCLNEDIQTVESISNDKYYIGLHQTAVKYLKSAYDVDTIMVISIENKNFNVPFAYIFSTGECFDIKKSILESKHKCVSVDNNFYTGGMLFHLMRNNNYIYSVLFDSKSEKNDRGINIDDCFISDPDNYQAKDPEYYLEQLRGELNEYFQFYAKNIAKMIIKKNIKN